MTAGVRLAIRPTLFVGRQAEMDRLREMLGRVPVALVCGVAGVGKTALASAFAAGWEGTVLRTDLAGDSLAELVDDARIQLGPGTEIGPVEARLRALAERLDDDAALWVIDDLHRLSPADRRLLLRVLGRRLQRGRALATSRERVGVDASGPDHAELRLEGLADADARQLWLELDRLYQPAGGFEAALSRSGGNPFLLRRGHAGDLADEDPVRDTTACLGPPERLAAGALALSEIALPVELIEELVPDGREALRRLADKMLVEVRAGGSVSMHDLVRDAVLRALGAEERERLHADLARLLPAASLDPARRARAVCRHLRALDRHEEAARYLIERGSELDKYGAAGELLRGLAAIPEQRRSPEASVLLARASARVFDLERAYAEHERLLAAGIAPVELVLIHALLALLTGRPAVAEASLDRIEQSSGLSPAHAIRALAIRSMVRAFTGQPGEADELLRAAADRAGDAASPLLLYRAFILWLEERDIEAHETIVRALVQRDAGALSYRASVLASTVQGTIAASLGRIAEAEAALAEGERRMAGDEDMLLATYVRHTRACLLHARGEWSAALAELRPLIERFRHGGHVAADLVTSTLEGRTLLVMGRRAEGLRRLDECRAAALERGLTGIARIADRALASDPARLPLGPQSGRDRPWSRLGEAIRAAAGGDAVRAGSLLAEAPEQEGELGRLLAAVARAVIAMAGGDAAEAQALLASARAAAIAEGIDPELIPALLASVGSLRVVTSVQSRIARESEGLAGDEVRLDARTHDLASASRTVSLVKRPVLRRMLYCLASRRGAVASKDALAAALWAREHNPLTDDGPLKSNIANLRKLIEEVGLSIDFDEVGYRLIGAERLVLVEPITWRVDPV